MAARSFIGLPLVVVLAAVLWTQASAQSGCTTAIISLAPCVSYIIGNSSTPSSSCCSQLSSIVQTQVNCLCTVLNGAAPFGLNINQTQAMALPNACNIQTPPARQCNAAGTPAPASPAAGPVMPSTPNINPSPAMPSTPLVPSEAPPTTSSTAAAPSIQSGGGSKTVPSTSGQSSDGSSVRLTLPLLFSLFFMASYASI